MSSSIPPSPSRAAERRKAEQRSLLLMTDEMTETRDRALERETVSRGSSRPTTRGEGVVEYDSYYGEDSHSNNDDFSATRSHFSATRRTTSSSQRRKKRPVAYVPRGYTVVLNEEDRQRRLHLLEKAVKARSASRIAEWWRDTQNRVKRKAHAARLRNLILFNARATLIQHWWRTIQNKENISNYLAQEQQQLREQQQAAEGGGDILSSAPLSTAHHHASSATTVLNREKSSDEALARLGSTNFLEQILENAKNDIISTERTAVSSIKHEGLKRIWEEATEMEPAYKAERNKAKEHLSPQQAQRRKERQRQRRYSAGGGAYDEEAQNYTGGDADGTDKASNPPSPMRKRSQSIVSMMSSSQTSKRSSNRQQRLAGGGNLHYTAMLPTLGGGMNSGGVSTAQQQFNSNNTHQSGQPSQKSRTGNYLNRQNPEKNQAGRYLRDEDCAMKLAAEKRDHQHNRGKNGKRTGMKNSSSLPPRASTSLGFEVVPISQAQRTEAGSRQAGDPSLENERQQQRQKKFNTTQPLKVTRPVGTPTFWNGSTHTTTPWWYEKPANAEKFKKLPELVKYL